LASYEHTGLPVGVVLLEAQHDLGIINSGFTTASLLQDESALTVKRLAVEECCDEVPEWMAG
jgi:hypothetical protein